MKPLGVIAGPNPESLPTYWNELLAEVRFRSGRQRTPRLLIETLDAGDLTDLADPSPRTIGLVSAAAGRLEQQGAGLLLLASSSFQPLAFQLAELTPLPVILMADATARKLAELGLSPVGVLGLNTPAKQDHWTERLKQHRVGVVPADGVSRELITEILQRNDGAGQPSPDARPTLARLSVELCGRGARAIVLTDPRLQPLLPAAEWALPTICAVQAHCVRAVELSLA